MPGWRSAIRAPRHRRDWTIIRQRAEGLIASLGSRAEMQRPAASSD
jgi:hypothetical protein